MGDREYVRFDGRVTAFFKLPEAWLLLQESLHGYQVIRHFRLDYAWSLALGVGDVYCMYSRTVAILL